MWLQHDHIYTHKQIYSHVYRQIWVRRYSWCYIYVTPSLQDTGVGRAVLTRPHEHQALGKALGTYRGWPLLPAGTVCVGEWHYPTLLARGWQCPTYDALVLAWLTFGTRLAKIYAWHCPTVLIQFALFIVGTVLLTLLALSYISLALFYRNRPEYCPICHA